MEDERFKSEMTRFMGVVITKLDHLETRFDGLEKEVRNNSQKLETLSGQFNEVGVMAINDNKRIDKLEIEVAELQTNIH